MLGPYELQERIGAGGMGEVFRAEDTRLGRVVAVKVLLTSVASDPDRLRRFEQEARTLASLNHPNILAVYDIGTVETAEGGSTPYIVSEFLEGETLRGKLDDVGAASARRAIEIALGIAKGLAAGHSKGIVHRDIKPENIFLTRDGRVKILDFGLAKLVQSGGMDSAETLMTSGGGTTPGLVLGTVGYMSPEQVRGRPAEATSDIFSFGVVLYELLSGKRAFKRDTAAETMTAVLREEPPALAESGWHGPPGLERILERCLEKDPERRFQSASDLGFAIEALSGSSSGSVVQSGISQSAVAAPPPVTDNKRSWMLPVALLAVIAAGLGGWWLAQKMLERTAPVFTQLTFQRGLITNARFAKDADTVIYSGQFDNDPLQIYSLRTGVLQPLKASVPSAALFAVSPGDEMTMGTDPVVLSNYLSGTLSEVPITGGTPRPLQKDTSSADYGADGKTLALTRLAGGRWVVEYPAGKKLYDSASYLNAARVSPDGKSVGFLEHPRFGDDRGWVAMVDSEGKMRKLTEEQESINGLAWAPGGDELWYAAAMSGVSDVLCGVRVSGGAGPGRVRKILSMPAGISLMDVAASGRVLLATQQSDFRISATDGATGKEIPHMELYNGSVLTDISPDGKAILFTEVGGSVGPLYEVVYRKTDGSPPLVLGAGSSPALSPDGASVAAILLTSPAQIVIYPVGAGENRTLPMGNIDAGRAMSWFPDGKRLAVLGSEQGKARRTYVMDVDSGKMEPLGPEHFQSIAVAKDGKRILGALSGQYVIFHTDTQQMQPLAGIGNDESPWKWTKDGQGLILMAGPIGGPVVVTRLELATGKRTVLKTVEAKDRAGVLGMNVAMAEDEKSYAVFEVLAKDALWMVDGVR